MTPAYDVLSLEGNFFTFTVNVFDNDAANPIMNISINRFSAPGDNELPDDDEDQTSNDMSIARNTWNENNPSALSELRWPGFITIDDLALNRTREYRFLVNGILNSPVAAQNNNKPLYEAIDDNIFEQQLIVNNTPQISFVWNILDEDGEDVSGKNIADYETYQGISFLEYANSTPDDWANITDYDEFDNGSILYTAQRLVNHEVIVVEAVNDSNSFSLAPTEFGENEADLTAAMDLYDNTLSSNKLEYRFTVDYLNHHSIFFKIRYR